jgi:CDP-diacylglycerol--glycerol-3-phosphate 3-phosphatidyltransferase
MTLYDLKPRFQALLRPGVRALHAHGITANQVTLAACALSVAVGIVIVLNAPATAWFALLPLWLFARMALNAIDGMLAREFNQASALGAYLNELCDVVSDAALYLPFAWLPGVTPAWVLTVVGLAALTELAGVLGVLAGASRRYDGPMGKSDRAFVFGAFALALALGTSPGRWLDLALAAVAALSAVTIVNRVRRGVAEAGARRSPGRDVDALAS